MHHLLLHHLEVHILQIMDKEERQLRQVDMGHPVVPVVLVPCPEVKTTIVLLIQNKV
jgi:hypothetical protein